MDSFYIYYRVTPANTPGARAAVKQLFAMVREATPAVPRLLARADDGQTWMEVFEAVGDVRRFTAALASATDASAIKTWIVNGERHVEHFRDSNEI